MAATKFGVNDPMEVKKWGTDLAVAINREAYFASTMMSESKRARTPIQVITDLEKGAGLEVTVDLLMPMGMEPVVQKKLEGTGVPLKYFTDKLRIEQVRGAASAGDRVTSKATLRNLREDAKVVMKDWWARLQDELFFIYLTGGLPGVDQGYLWTAGNAMFTVNAPTAPDSNHIMYGGNATSKITIGNDDGFDLRLIDRAVAKSETMGGDGSDELSMVPVNVDGKKCYVVLMHTFQYDAMKSSTATGQWLDIQKAAAAASGSNSLLFKNSGGMYADCVIHKHRNVPRFNDYGGASVKAARAMFLGSQAASLAYGSGAGSGATRYRWTEVMTDHEDHVEIGTHCILGVKKSTYKSKDGQVTRDFGVIALDTYCADVV